MLRRSTFGFTEADAADVWIRGWDAWLDWQLDPESIDDSALDAQLAGYDWLSLDAHDMLHHPSLEVWEIGHAARAVRLLRNQAETHTRGLAEMDAYTSSQIRRTLAEGLAEGEGEADR